MKKTTYIKIGVIISITIFVFFWSVNFLKSKGAFNNDNVFYIVYERIDGLDISNPVLINGFAVGKVRDIDFLPDTSGRLVVEIAIKNKYQIPGKSIARIFSSDLMGTKAIDLIFGDAKYMQQSGDTLIADFEGSLQEMVSIQMLPLKNKAEDLMKQMEEAIEVVNYIFNKDTRDDILTSFKNIKATFVNLENSSSNLDSIVSDGKHKMENILSNVESISQNLEQNNELITRTLKNISNITDSIAQSDLKQAILETQGILSQLNEITKKINNSEGTIGLLINNDTLYNNLEDVTYNLNRVLEDLRLNPKRYVQFSAFNLGKTVYVEEDQTDTKGKKAKAVYKVMIHQSNKSVPLNPKNFKNYKNVEEAMVNGTYIYVIGHKKNIESARLLLKEVINDFADAKIVEIKEGKYSIIE